MTLAFSGLEEKGEKHWMILEVSNVRLSFCENLPSPCCFCRVWVPWQPLVTCSPSPSGSLMTLGWDWRTAIQSASLMPGTHCQLLLNPTGSSQIPKHWQLGQVIGTRGPQFYFCLPLRGFFPPLLIEIRWPGRLCSRLQPPPFLWSLPSSCLLIVPDVQDLPCIQSTSFSYGFIIYYWVMHVCLCVHMWNAQGGLECAALCPVSAMLLLSALNLCYNPSH